MASSIADLFNLGDESLESIIGAAPDDAPAPAPANEEVRSAAPSPDPAAASMDLVIKPTSDGTAVDRDLTEDDIVNLNNEERSPHALQDVQAHGRARHLHDQGRQGHRCRHRAVQDGRWRGRDRRRRHDAQHGRDPPAARGRARGAGPARPARPLRQHGRALGEVRCRRCVGGGAARRGDGRGPARVAEQLLGPVEGRAAAERHVGHLPQADGRARGRAAGQARARHSVHYRARDVWRLPGRRVQVHRGRPREGPRLRVAHRQRQAHHPSARAGWHGRRRSDGGGARGEAR